MRIGPAIAWDINNAGLALKLWLNLVTAIFKFHDGVLRVASSPGLPLKCPLSGLGTNTSINM